MQTQKPNNPTSTTLRIPFPSPYRIPSISEHSGTFSVSFNAGRVRLPPSLNSIVVGDLGKALDKCNRAALAAHNRLQTVHKEREQRYRKLCPNDPEIYNSHASSVDRLFAWCSDHGNEPYNPTLAPAAKIPYFGTTLTLDRKAYAAWSRSYRRLLKDFEDTEYKEYNLARMEFETMMYIARAKGTISAEAFRELDVFWKDCFMREMRKWEEDASRQLALPAYEIVTREVLVAVFNRVENGERLVRELQEQQLGWSPTPTYCGYFPGL